MHTHGEAFELYAAVVVVSVVIGLLVLMMIPYV